MKVPESREVWEHSEREYDRRDARLGRIAMGVMAAVLAVALLLVLALTR